MVTESEAMEEGGNSSVSAADMDWILHGVYELVSQNRGMWPRWSSPIRSEEGSFVFPTAMISVWFHHVGI